jgi:hypothetical protein
MAERCGCGEKKSEDMKKKKYYGKKEVKAEKKK